ncbi:outer membrane protein [Phreatobacter stygius]|nr:outer membrane beta-barrel protein [Phreatobacter stygius]
MKRLALALIAVSLVATAGGSAEAADLGGRMPAAPLAPPVLAEDFASGWYVRGDLSASLFRRASLGAGNTSYFAPGQWADLNATRAGSAFGGGLGVGFKYKWFRLDATLDIRSAARFSGMAPPNGDWLYAGPLPVPARNERFSVTSQTALINAYVDLGGWGGVTPYVGAGLGVARLSASSYSSTPVPAAAALGEIAVTPALTGTTKWNLAAAAMAGVTFDITPQARLDIGYRYLHMGSLRFADTAGGSYRAGPVAAHEIRIGLRYMFGDGLGPAGQ